MSKKNQDPLDILCKLIPEANKARKRYVTAHNDRLCGIKTPTAADKRDVAAAKRRSDILHDKVCAIFNQVMFLGVPELLTDPRKNLG